MTTRDANYKKKKQKRFISLFLKLYYAFILKDE